MSISRTGRFAILGSVLSLGSLSIVGGIIPIKVVSVEVTIHFPFGANGRHGNSSGQNSQAMELTVAAAAPVVKKEEPCCDFVLDKKDSSRNHGSSGSNIPFDYGGRGFPDSTNYGGSGYGDSVNYGGTGFADSIKLN